MQAEYGRGLLTDVSLDAARDRDVGRACVARASLASWWKWKDGSTLFFWRWARAVRDGVPVFVGGDLPNCKQQMQQEQDKGTKAHIIGNLSKVVARRYVSKGLVKSLTKFFSVPKGEDNICMVYDASALGLNDALWAPNFGLPDVDSVLS